MSRREANPVADLGEDGAGRLVEALGKALVTDGLQLREAERVRRDCVKTSEQSLGSHATAQ